MSPATRWRLREYRRALIELRMLWSPTESGQSKAIGNDSTVNRRG